MSAGSSSSSPRDVCVVAAARTPLGSFLGALSGVRAPELAGVAIKGASSR